MITACQARILRGLVAHHARCQWNLGATAGGRGDEAQRKILVEQAEKARHKVYAFIRAQQGVTPAPTRQVQRLPNFQQISKGRP